MNVFNWIIQSSQELVQLGSRKVDSIGCYVNCIGEQEEYKYSVSKDTAKKLPTRADDRLRADLDKLVNSEAYKRLPTKDRKPRKGLDLGAARFPR